MHDMYIRLDTAAQVVTLGGVSFAAFYACAKLYIRNMLLLKSDYVGTHCCKNFELLCGQDEIKAFLASEDLRFGDFCFVDFADGANPDALWNRKNILAVPVRTLSLSSEGWTIV